MTTLATRRAWHLARLMRDRGVKSPGELARAAGLDYSRGREAIGSMLRKGSQPRDATLEAISRALHVCPSVFHSPTDLQAQAQEQDAPPAVDRA